MPTALNKAAIRCLSHYNNLFGKQGFTLKIGMEIEFTVLAIREASHAEVLTSEAIQELQKKLESEFPEVVERVYKEWGFGWTTEDEEFEFPGARQYEITLKPDSDPLRLLDNAYKVRNFIDVYLINNREISISWGPMPIREDKLLDYIEKARCQSPERFASFKGVPVIQPTGTSVQFNISLWNGEKNVFFDENTRDGSELFYAAVKKLIELERDKTGSILPFISGDDAVFEWTNPAFDQSASPAYAAVRQLKGTATEGKGSVRPSPLRDEDLEDDYPNMNKERRSNETFRAETRLNDPSFDLCVCLAATIGAFYVGIQQVTFPSKEQVVQMSSPENASHFARNLEEAIEDFKNSSWLEVLGADLYNEIINYAINHTNQPAVTESYGRNSPRP